MRAAHVHSKRARISRVDFRAAAASSGYLEARIGNPFIIRTYDPGLRDRRQHRRQRAAPWQEAGVAFEHDPFMVVHLTSVPVPMARPRRRDSRQKGLWYSISRAYAPDDRAGSKRRVHPSGAVRRCPGSRSRRSRSVSTPTRDVRGAPDRRQPHAERASRTRTPAARQRASDEILHRGAARR